jgi:hypothetical protein
MHDMISLGTTFTTGQIVPEDGNYQLVNDNTKPEWSRTNLSRVIVLLKGKSFPPHPDTGAVAEWRFIRVISSAGHDNPDMDQ